MYLTRGGKEYIWGITDTKWKVYTNHVLSDLVPEEYEFYCDHQSGNETVANVVDMFDTSKSNERLYTVQVDNHRLTSEQHMIRKDMREFEYVSKSEWKPIWNEWRGILEEVGEITAEQGLDFEPRLIGSANRHLVTREIGGNKGFDLDVNLVIPELPNHGKHLGKIVFDILMRSLNEVLGNSRYSPAEGSTSVFTIKCKDPENSRIIHSVDLAVMFYDEYGDAYALCYYKDNGGHGFQRRFFEDVRDKESWVKNNVYWNEVRDMYLDLKNKNPDLNKHSRHIYYETINNLYNTYNDIGQEERTCRAIMGTNTPRTRTTTTPTS